MSLPHDTWADVYDTVYERHFGPLYNHMTRANLEALGEIAPPGSRIIDYGAGTGRLALPLAEAGHHVVAVEPSAEMVRVLDAKAAVAGVPFATIVAAMDTYVAPESANVAVCVFTVINYVTDDDALRRSFEGMAHCLEPGGLLMIDIASRALFHGGYVESDGLMRDIRIEAIGTTDIFRYSETTEVDIDGHVKRYEDAFPIRWWRRAEVESAWTGAGLSLHSDISHKMQGTGAEYVVLAKPGD